MTGEKNPETADPFRIVDVLAIWTRIARMMEALWACGTIKNTSAVMRQRIEHAARDGETVFDASELRLTLVLLAAPEAMNAHDWLRMKVVDAQRRISVAAHPLDLRGLRCRRLVITMNPTGEGARVTVHNRRGDVVSVEGHTLSNALEGAIRMAGARSEEP